MTPHRGPIAALASAVLLLLPDAGSAQVIRSYESLDRSAGDALYAAAVISVDGAMGNADFFDTDLSVAVGRRGARHWVRLYPTYRLKRTDGRTVIDTRAVHLRHSLLLTERTRTFVFAQWQTETAIELDRRVLIGGGIRQRLVQFGEGGLDLGVGLMFDEEQRTARAVRSDVRGTNLVSAYGQAAGIDLSVVLFFQPRLADWTDHRISVLGSVVIPIVTHVGLDLSSSWRRDARAPTGIERHDAGLRVGIRLSAD